MRDVKSLDNNNGDNDPAANSGTTAATTSKNIEPLPDLIQDWWTQVVEPMYVSNLHSLQALPKKENLRPRKPLLRLN